MAKRKVLKQFQESSVEDYREFYKGTYLSALDVPEGKDVAVTIVTAQLEEVVNPQGAKDRKVTILTDLDSERPLILNKTNADSIFQLLKTRKMGDAIGKKIYLYRTTERAFGETHEVVRVRPYLPGSDNDPNRPKAERTLKPDEFERMLKAIAGEKLTKENALEYGLTEAQRKEVEAL